MWEAVGIAHHLHETPARSGLDLSRRDAASAFSLSPVPASISHGWEKVHHALTGTLRCTQVRVVAALEASFEELFAAECGYVVRTLTRLGVHSSDVEDVAQDVFIAVHHRLCDYDASRPAKPWLFAFAFRAAANYRRLARHRRERTADDESATSATQDDELEAAQRRAMLHGALEALDLEHRAAIVAVDLDGVPAKDAARAMGIPLNTLYSRVRNGRKKLRAVLSGDQRLA